MELYKDYAKRGWPRKNFQILWNHPIMSKDKGYFYDSTFWRAICLEENYKSNLISLRIKITSGRYTKEKFNEIMENLDLFNLDYKKIKMEKKLKDIEKDFE